VVRAALGAALVLALTGAARADDAGDRARAAALQAEGHRLLNAGDAAGALDRFQAAFHLVASPKILFNMGRAHEKLGDDIAAYEAFDRFLAEAGDVPPESRAAAERSRAAARARIALVELVTPAGANLLVDGKPAGRTPLARPLALAPGTRVFRLERDGKLLSEKAVPVLAGAVTRFVIDVTQAAPLAWRPVDSPAPAPARLFVEEPGRGPAPAPSYSHWWLWAGVGVLAASAVAVAYSAGAFKSRDAGCPRAWQCP
jgi:hypothetical protein